MRRFPTTLRAVACALFASACIGADKRPAFDGDRDGVPATEDCDDLDAEIGGPDLLYLDVDGDGYGRHEGTWLCPDQAETLPTSRFSGDCADRNKHRHPDAREVCNDIDDDCDGAIDDHDADVDAVHNGVLLFADADNDGFGATAPRVWRCDPEWPGLAPNHDDCNDSNPAVHPDAREVCNGIDDDCDGRFDDEDGSVWVGDTAGVRQFRDADGDGHAAIGATSVLGCALREGHALTDDDCDDEDPDTSPSAVEACNGVDDDCDGLIDTDDDDLDPTTGTAYYLDEDGDNYGVDDVIVYDCYAWGRSGYASRPGDCDDTDPTIRPHAAEVCDGIDNDCDGDIDLDDASPDYTSAVLVYPDADHDGYGDQGSPGDLACEAGTGESEVYGDCDDTADSIRPNAVEDCSNGVDDDCDGTIDNCGFRDSYQVGWSTPFHGVVPSGDGGMVGADLNGDGLDDLLVSGPPATGTGDSAVYVLYGSATSGEVPWTTPVELHAGASADGLITSYGAPGDLDGDGYDELLLGAPSDGEVHLVYGSATALSGPLSIAAAAQATLYTTTAIGEEHAGVGDVNGDGLDDLLVVTTTHGAATAYLIQGSTSRLSGSVLDTTVASGSLEPGFLTYNFGSDGAVDGADIDGDGLSDIIVGDNTYQDTTSREGTALLWMGPVSGTTPPPDTTITSSAPTPYLCIGDSTELIGDINGDGLADIAVGASGYSDLATYGGAVFVFLGSTTVPARLDTEAADLTLAGSLARSFLMRAHSLGDVDGDGVNDLAVGTSHQSTTSTSLRRGWIGGVLGGASDLSGVVDAFSDREFEVVTSTGPDRTGLAEAVVAADMDGDGQREIWSRSYVPAGFDTTVFGVVPAVE